MANYEEARFATKKLARSMTDAWTTHGFTRPAAQLHLEVLNFRFTAVSGATSFSWYISYDADGEYCATDIVTGQAINAAKTGSIAAANVATSIGGGNDSRSQTDLYLHVKIEQASGTATFDVFLAGALL